MADCAGPITITTITQCKNAQASVDQMNDVFARLGSEDKYSNQVQAITQNLAAAMPLLASIGIGIGMCGTAAEIGTQADLLTNQMLTDHGMATVPGPSCLPQSVLPSFQFPSGTQILETVALVLLGAFAIYLLMEK
jgi:hypothetical protein